MDIFKKNITKLYGEKGKKWLFDLDQTISDIQAHWHLSEITPVDNMTYNYVAKAIDEKKREVVVKVAFDKRSYENEVNALVHFNGHGSVMLIDLCKDRNAMLLQLAKPGVSLKSLYPKQIDLVMDEYVSILNKIHKNVKFSDEKFDHVSTWLGAIDKCKSENISKKLLTKAIDIKNHLLSSIKDEKLLHGDLHLDNILQDKKVWLAIDPKGVVGEKEFEIAAFDFIDESEIGKITSDVFVKRIELLAKKAKLCHQRITKWVFVRLVLSIVWSLEDNTNPKRAIFLANLLFDFC
jgi:streptomycin 6-kinase